MSGATTATIASAITSGTGFFEAVSASGATTVAAGTNVASLTVEAATAGTGGSVTVNSGTAATLVVQDDQGATSTGANTWSITAPSATNVTMTAGDAGDTFTATLAAATTATLTGDAGVDTFNVTFSKAATITASTMGAGNDKVNLTLANGTNTLALDLGAGTADAATLTLAGGTLSLTGATATETLSIASSGAANTVNVTTCAADKTTITGDQSITFSGASSVYNARTFTDSTTAGTTTATVGATTDGNDLSKVATDVIELTRVTADNDTLTFASGASLKLNLDTTGQGNTLDLLSTSTSDTISIDVAVAAADMSMDTTTYFKTVNLSASTVATTVAAVMGANTTVNVSGSKNVSFSNASTAKAVDATSLSGNLTAYAWSNTSALTKVTGGSGADTVYIHNVTDDVAFTLDGGAGSSDTLKITEDLAADLSNGTNDKTSVITGFEVVDVNGAALTLTQKQLFTNGATFTLKDTAATNDGTLSIVMNSDSALSVDLSGMQYGFVAAGGVGGVTITGTGSADTITASSSADTVTGAAGNDTITAGEGIDFIVAGGGADTTSLTETTAAVDYINFTALTDGSAAGAAAGTFSGFDVITGFATTSDKIRVDSNVTDGTTDIDVLVTAKIVKASSAAATDSKDLTISDYTNVDKVVAFLNDMSQAYSNAASDIVAVTFTDFTALYIVNDSGSDDTLAATEIKLIGTVDEVLVAGDMTIV